MPMKLENLKKQLRDGAYAWPGGYPKYFINRRDEPLCFRFVMENWGEICRNHIKYDAGAYYDGNMVIACAEINWEDPYLFCAETNDRIESAYAEDAA